MTENNPFLGQTEVQEYNKKNIFIMILEILALILSIGLFLYLFVLTPNQVNGPSMSPTLKNGDIILVNTLSRLIGDTDIGKSLGLNLKHGDIVVFQNPNIKNEEIVKRIIGMPGDKVAIKKQKIYVNDKEISEKYLKRNILTPGGTFLEDNGESKFVPPDSYFVIGDNRTESIDSRDVSIGFVRKDLIKGKVFFRIWPLESFGIVE